MALTQYYVVGRVQKRLLRSPTVIGWLCDDHDPSRAEAATLALRKRGNGLALQVPGAGGLIPLSDELSALITAEEGLEVLIGWPNAVTLVRRQGELLRGEGDVLHFGRLALDHSHAIERCGYEYIAASGVEVCVELAREQPDRHDTVMLGPETSTHVGPFLVKHDHSYDPGDRPGTARHAAYRFFVTGPRAGQGRPAEVPYPPEMTAAELVVELARKQGAFEPDEAMLCESAQIDEYLERYEGPRQLLEDACRAAGPTPPLLHHVGDGVVAEVARLFRGEDGSASYGRARITLDATGQVRIERSDLGSAPGRLRRAKP